MDLELRIRVPHEEYGPIPLPQSRSENGPDSSDEIRRRMGTYVRFLLEGHEQVQVPGWRLETGWDTRRLWATLTRGELVIEADVTVREWWAPPSKPLAARWAIQIGQLLWKLQRQYAATDETGRTRLSAWWNGSSLIAFDPRESWEPVELLLEPGVRAGTVNGGSMVTFERLGCHTTRYPAAAIADGWISVLVQKRTEISDEKLLPE